MQICFNNNSAKISFRGEEGGGVNICKVVLGQFIYLAHRARESPHP